MRVKGQLLGTSGTYYVMAQLAVKGFHAACTFGNAPYVDILVSAPDGKNTLAIQTKTAERALRLRGRGPNRRPHHLEWNLGRKLAKLSHKNVFFAFVDMKGGKMEALPDVYIVPSTFVASYCEDWVDKVKWVRFHPNLAEMQPYKNNWKILKEALRLSERED